MPASVSRAAEAEAVLPGQTSEETFFSTSCCHPLMANNELSGPILTTVLYRYLRDLPEHRNTYRCESLLHTKESVQ